MENSNKPSRSYRSDEEIKTLLKEFEESNVTVKEFCEIYSVSEPTFYSWRSKYAPKYEKQGEFPQLVNDLTVIDTLPYMQKWNFPQKLSSAFLKSQTPVL
jgi:hypothetical protein